MDKETTLAGLTDSQLVNDVHRTSDADERQAAGSVQAGGEVGWLEAVVVHETSSPQMMVAMPTTQQYGANR